MSVWSYLGVKETLWQLKSNEKGLSNLEVEKRKEKYGYNELIEAKKDHFFKKIIQQFTNYLILILIIAMIVSFIAGHIIDAVVIGVIVFLNGILGFVQEYKAEQTMAALKKLSPPTAIVMRNGKEMKIDARELVPGDIVMLEAGDNIPADCRLISAIQLKVDESSLTGESVPVSKSINQIKGTVSIGEMKNILFMSTNITYGTAKAVVVETGMNTQLGKIASMIQENEKQTPLQKRLEHFGKEIGILVLLISAIIALIGIIQGKPVIDMFIIGVSIAVAAVPEGLPAVVTITLALGLQRMAKKNAIIRKLPAVETLGSTTIICSDKTGTITKNEMTVTEIYSDKKLIQVNEKEHSKKGNFCYNEKSIDIKKSKNISMILKIGLLCNNAVIEDGELIGDPTEGALVTLAEKGGFGRETTRHEFKKITELPFDSNRKMMTTIHMIDSDDIKSDYESYTKGATEMVLAKCKYIYKNGKVVKITKKEILEIKEQEKEMASRALRVLAFAYKNISKQKEYTFKTEENMIFVGLIGMIDPPREEVKYAINKCKTAGIRVMMITGDYEITAKAIAEKVGLFKEGDKILTGTNLEQMNEAQLKEAVNSINIFARISPEHKMKIVKALKEQGHIVAVTGDGVNDAPALKKADIGIAMGITGTDVSKQASDMILTDDNFSTIVIAIEEGRTIFENIKKFIQYLLSCNAGEVLTMLVASAIGFATLPLVPVQILWMNLVTDGLPAITLGLDPSEKNIMKRKPIKDRRALDKKTAFKIIGIGSLMCIITLFVFYSELNSNPEIAGTMAFTTLMMLQMGIIFNIKTEQSIFKGGNLINNKFLIGSVLLSIALQILVIYHPLMQIFFQTTALPLIKLLEIFIIAFLVFLGIEIVKIKYPTM